MPIVNRDEATARFYRKHGVGVPFRINPNAQTPTSLTATAAANTAVTIVVPVQGDVTSICIGDIQWSYSSAPVAGGLTILDGATLVYQIDITLAGPNWVGWTIPRRGTEGNSMTITLAAGGGTSVGKLNVHAWSDL